MSRILIILFLTNLFAAHCAGQGCDMSLNECNCAETTGIDLTKQDCGNYFTRGRPEYEDFCNGCVVPRFYMSLFGGTSLAKNLDRNQPTLPVEQLGASLVYGGLAGISAGKYWNSRLRTEVEFTYSKNNAESWFERSAIGGVAQTLSEVPATGVFERVSGMVNMTFDLSPRRTQLPNMYAGAGVGITQGKGLFSTTTDLFQVDDTSLAWQWILGANYALSSNIDFFAEYRFLQAENFNVQDQTLGQSLGDFEIRSHDVVFGFRISM